MRTLPTGNQGPFGVQEVTDVLPEALSLRVSMFSRSEAVFGVFLLRQDYKAAVMTQCVDFPRARSVPQNLRISKLLSNVSHNRMFQELLNIAIDPQRRQHTSSCQNS